MSVTPTAWTMLLSVFLFVGGTSDLAHSTEPVIAIKPLDIDPLLRKISAENRAMRLQADRIDGMLCDNQNFSVMCMAPEVDSRHVLARADEFRKQIAMDWLGKELPATAEYAFIHVTLSRDMDEGLTLLSQRPEQGAHRIWLTTSPQRALGSTLAHEIAHVVLKGNFPRGMPAWANEGIASTYDDSERKAARDRRIAILSSDGQLPAVATILDQQQIAPTDQRAYAVANSLTTFLVSQGGKARFVEFIQRAMTSGWDEALNKSYQIRSVSELQKRWELWVSGATPSATASVSRYRFSKS